MSRIYELLKLAEQERRAAVPEMRRAIVDREQIHATAASVADPERLVVKKCLAWHSKSSSA
jgi:hypothetical protein